MESRATKTTDLIEVVVLVHPDLLTYIAKKAKVESIPWREVAGRYVQAGVEAVRMGKAKL